MLLFVFKLFILSSWNAFVINPELCLEIVLDPILATNKSSEEYFDESSDSDQTNSDSQWLDEFIEETGKRYAGIYSAVWNY